MARHTKAREPAPAAISIFATVLLVTAARIGSTASRGAIFAAAAKEATEIAVECASANPATAAPAITPVSPSQCLSAADPIIITPINAASPSAMPTLKARPCPVAACPSGGAARNADPKPQSAATTAPAANAGAINRKTGRERAASRIASRIKVETVEKAAPAMAAFMHAGAFFARPAIEPIVAALEMKPEANPVMGNP